MPQINCHLPIKLRLVGSPNEAQLEQLGQTLVRTLQAQLALAERTIRARHLVAPVDAPAPIQESYDLAYADPDRAHYQIPSYDRQGQRVSMRLAKRAQPEIRPWMIRKAINFHARVGDFLDLVESLAPQQTLAQKVLYIDHFAALRWVSLWLVQVNENYTLAALEAILATRADQLSGRGEQQILTYALGTTEQFRRKLSVLDKDGLVTQAIPNLQRLTQHRIMGMGDETLVLAGGWLLFASMVLPLVDANDHFDEVPAQVISLPLHKLEFIVKGESFTRLFGLDWAEYISEHGDQLASLHMLPVTPLQRVHFQTLKYLAEAMVAANVDKDSAYFGNLYLLNHRVLSWLPAAARKTARALSDENTIALSDARQEGMWESGWHGAFIYTTLNPTAQQSTTDPPAAAAVALPKPPQETPNALISRFTSWGNLDEDGLGAYLVTLLRQRPALSEYVQAVLDELGSTNQDDVSLAFAQSATDSDLEQLAQSASGRSLLVRLYDELTSGNLDEAEQSQAQRILGARVRARSIELVLKRLARNRGLIFPFRKSGPTVWDDAPIMAERLQDGRIRVKYPQRVQGTAMFRAETHTLPSQVFTRGIELDADEWVSVKLYDEGGITVQQPALYLLELANVGTTSTLIKIATVSATALSFGLGGGAIAGSSRVVVFLDRAATAIGILGILVDDHRGWIIATFGDAGRTFIKAVGVAQALAGLYGLGRVAFSVPQVVRSLRRSWKNWRSTPAYQELRGDNLRQAEAISQKTEQFLTDMDDAATAMRQEATASGTPSTPPPSTTPPTTAPDLPASGPTGGTPPSTTGAKPPGSTPSTVADDEAGLGIFGKKAPAPSGPISADLKLAYLKQLESRWFRTKLRAYAKLTRKGEIDWDELKRMVDTAEFREYATAWEAAQSLGYAGKSGDQIVLAMSKKIRKIPILGNSAMQHELVHVYQEMVGQVLSKEVAKSLSYPKVLAAEVAANIFGSPAVLITFVGITGLVLVITGGVLYVITQ